MHFGACKWRINPPSLPPSTEEVPLKREEALHCTLPIHAYPPLLACLRIFHCISPALAWVAHESKLPCRYFLPQIALHPDCDTLPAKSIGASLSRPPSRSPTRRPSISGPSIPPPARMAPCLIIMGDGKEGGSAAICCTEEGRKEGRWMQSRPSLSRLNAPSPSSRRAPRGRRRASSQVPFRVADRANSAKTFRRQILRFQVDLKKTSL